MFLLELAWALRCGFRPLRLVILEKVLTEILNVGPSHFWDNFLSSAPVLTQELFLFELILLDLAKLASDNLDILVRLVK